MEPGTVVQRVAAYDRPIGVVGEGHRREILEEKYWVTAELPRTWEERRENHCLEHPMYRSLCDRLIQIAHDTMNFLPTRSAHSVWTLLFGHRDRLHHVMTTLSEVVDRVSPWRM